MESPEYVASVLLHDLIHDPTFDYSYFLSIHQIPDTQSNPFDSPITTPKSLPCFSLQSITPEIRKSKLKMRKIKPYPIHSILLGIDDMEGQTVLQLKTSCRERGLLQTGSKQTLLERLVMHNKRFERLSCDSTHQLF